MSTKTDADNGLELLGDTGLAIAPYCHKASGRAQFDGSWVAVHAASRLAAHTPEGLGIGHARDAARLLAAYGINWNAPADELAASPEVTTASNEVTEVIRQAVHEHRPAITKTSWCEQPPAWVVDVIDFDGDTIDSAEVHTYVVAETAAVLFAEEYEVDSTDTIEGAEDVVIYRGSYPTWSMRCAASTCTEELLGEADPFLLVAGNRQVVGAWAHEDGWRKIDERRWLCPACSIAYRSSQACCVSRLV